MIRLQVLNMVLDDHVVIKPRPTYDHSDPLMSAQITSNSFTTKERSSTATVSCGQRPQHLRGHREDIVVVGPHSSLWPKAKTFERSQRGIFLVKTPTVHCGQRPHHLQKLSWNYNLEF